MDIQSTEISHLALMSDVSQKTGRMLWLSLTCDISMKWKAVEDSMVSFKIREVGLSNDTNFM